jgi:hypothetical protein
VLPWPCGSQPARALVEEAGGAALPEEAVVLEGELVIYADGRVLFLLSTYPGYLLVSRQTSVQFRDMKITCYYVLISSEESTPMEEISFNFGK